MRLWRASGESIMLSKSYLLNNELIKLSRRTSGILNRGN